MKKAITIAIALSSGIMHGSESISKAIIADPITTCTKLYVGGTSSALLTGKLLNALIKNSGHTFTHEEGLMNGHLNIACRLDTFYSPSITKIYTEKVAHSMCVLGSCLSAPLRALVLPPIVGPVCLKNIILNTHEITNPAIKSFLKEKLLKRIALEKIVLKNQLKSTRWALLGFGMPYVYSQLNTPESSLSKTAQDMIKKFNE